MKIRCPHCQRALGLPDGALPERARCPLCKQIFAVPKGPAGAPQPASQSPETAPPTAPAPSLGTGLGEAPGLSLQEPAAPPGPPALGGGPGVFAERPVVRRRRAPSRAGLKVAGIALGGIAALVILWVFVLPESFRRTVTRGLFGGGLGDFAYYLPKDAATVAHFDLARFRRSDLYDELAKDIKAGWTNARGELGGLKLDFDDIDAVSFALAEDGSTGVVLLRTSDDADLADVVKDYRKKDKEEHEGFPYVKLNVKGEDAYIAKTASRTFCFASSEKLLKDTLERVRARDKLDLNENLQRVLDRVTDHDHYFVYSPPRKTAKRGAVSMAPMPVQQLGKDVNGSGVGISIGSSLSVEAIVGFQDRGEAKEKADDIEESLEDLIKEGEKAFKREKGKERRMTETMLDVLKSVRVRRRGELVAISASMKVSKLIDVIGEFKSQLGRFVPSFTPSRPRRRAVPKRPVLPPRPAPRPRRPVPRRPPR